MQWASRSETGPRDNNEDAVYASPRLVAVADGVGGAAAGEVASGWAVNVMRGLDARRLTGPLAEALRDAVAEADDGLAFLVDCRPELTGMGTTLTAVALSNRGDYLVANLGDSRTYLLRSGALRRLTRDDSFVQELIDRGELTPDDARLHPRRSVVMRALDGSGEAIAEPARHPARIGDRLLLCSDGISDYLDDAAITDALGRPDAADAAAALVDGALAAGGRDNVSAVVADVVARTDARAGWLPAL